MFNRRDGRGNGVEWGQGEAYGAVKGCLFGYLGVSQESQYADMAIISDQFGGFCLSINISGRIGENRFHHDCVTCINAG